MKTRLMAALAGFAALGSLASVMVLSTGHASAQQGPPPAGPQGGALTERVRRPGAQQLQQNFSAKITIAEAAAAATEFTPGFASMAQLRMRPNGNMIWFVHVVTKPAEGADRGTGVNVLVDAATGKATQGPDLNGAPRTPAGGVRTGAGGGAAGGNPPPARSGGNH